MLIDIQQLTKDLIIKCLNHKKIASIEEWVSALDMPQDLIEEWRNGTSFPDENTSRLIIIKASEFLQEIRQFKNEVDRYILASLSRDMGKEDIVERILSNKSPEPKILKKYVYFISNGAQVKIGFTENPKTRISGIQTSTPQSLSVLAVIEGDSKLERELHDKFKDHRIQGEWFHLVPEINQYIENLTENLVSMFFGVPTDKGRF